MNSDPSGCKQP